ncbi:hypothetical protein MKEN_00522800 [Mycena kentingensis (nom. inval.)]|nr:hypothetical protein MKEN_00522800 [Mycena kentingensis (nom. inval.)]
MLRCARLWQPSPCQVPTSPSPSTLPLFLYIPTMAFSSVGKVKVAAHLFLLVLNLVVFALSVRVNIYQEFFFVADRFPLIIASITFGVVGLMTFIDYTFNSSYTGRPQFEIGVFSVLGIFWLAFNSFSSSRWRNIPLNCGVIPAEYSDVVGYCQELNALRALIWIEWLVDQNNRGNRHIFKMPLSRYEPSLQMDDANFNYGRDSQFLAYGKLN